MSELFAFLGSLGPFHWLGLGLALLVAELLTGTTYILWPALAAMVTGMFLFFLPIAWPVQLLVFAGAALGLTAAGHRFARHYFFRKSEMPALNDRAAQLVGQTAIAAEAFVAGQGRVRLGDSEWAAMLAPDPEPGPGDMGVNAGQAVMISGLDGPRLIVRPLPLLPRALPGSETNA
jgi:inner membrane protein